jgi:hypothetical protein
MSRDHFFCGLFILAVANGLEGYVLNDVVTKGWSDGVISLFGVSAVVWFACFAASGLLYRSRVSEVITIPDAVIGFTIFSLTILPFARFSWLALTVLSLYMLCVAPARSPRQRSALIAFAITGPMLWGPALFDVFGTQILQADAILVSTLIGTDHVGNVFSAVIGSGGSPAHFMVYPGCSSLVGISIAVLAWITISTTLGSIWSARYFVCGLLAVASVLAVNVIRLSLIGLFPVYFPVIHGSPGADIASWLSITIIITISLLGIGREALRT